MLGQVRFPVPHAHTCARLAGASPLELQPSVDLTENQSNAGSIIDLSDGAHRFQLRECNAV